MRTFHTPRISTSHDEAPAKATIIKLSKWTQNFWLISFCMQSPLIPWRCVQENNTQTLWLVHDIQMLWYDWCEIHTLMRQSDWSKIHTLMQRSDWCEQHTTLHANIELFFEIFLDNLSPLDFRYARRGKKIKLKAFRKPVTWGCKLWPWKERLERLNLRNFAAKFISNSWKRLRNECILHRIRSKYPTGGNKQSLQVQVLHVLYLILQWSPNSIRQQGQLDLYRAWYWVLMRFWPTGPSAQLREIRL